MTIDRLMVGVVTPHEAAGPEVELPAMTRGRVATIVSRTGPPPGAAQTPSRMPPTAHAYLRASTETDALDRAATTFMGTTLLGHRPRLDHHGLPHRPPRRSRARRAPHSTLRPPCRRQLRRRRGGVAGPPARESPAGASALVRQGARPARREVLPRPGVHTVPTTAGGLPENPQQVARHTPSSSGSMLTSRTRQRRIPRRARVPDRARDRRAGLTRMVGHRGERGRCGGESCAATGAEWDLTGQGCVPHAGRLEQSPRKVFADDRGQRQHAAAATKSGSANAVRSFLLSDLPWRGCVGSDECERRRAAVKPPDPGQSNTTEPPSARRCLPRGGKRNLATIRPMSMCTLCPLDRAL